MKILMLNYLHFINLMTLCEMISVGIVFLNTLPKASYHFLKTMRIPYDAFQVISQFSLFLLNELIAIQFINTQIS